MSKSYQWGLLETDSNGETQFVNVDEILKRAADGRMQLNHEVKQGLARLRKSEPGGMVNQRTPLGRPGYEVSQPPVLKRATEVAATTNSGKPQPLGRPSF